MVLATGATNGDAIIYVASLAERHPFRFVFVTVGPVGLGLVLAALVLKIVVLGPLGNQRALYNDKREQGRNSQPRLPL